MKTLITLKIGRNNYKITANDLFIDNKACIQLMVDNKTWGRWRPESWPLLSKKAIKEISGFARIEQKNNEYYDNKKITVFTLGENCNNKKT